MRKLLVVAVVAVAAAVVTPLALANPSAGKLHRFPLPHASYKQLAAACMLEAVGAGAFASMEPKEVADYCIEAAKRIRGDYSIDPRPDLFD